MKRLLLLILCCVFILSVSRLFLNAQDVRKEPAEGTQTEKKEDPKTDKEKTTVFTIGEIVVKQKRIANIEQSSTTTIVTAKDIEAHDDRDLSDTLKLVPGMSVSQSQKGHTRFRMRGFEMPYVALLVDGIPLGDVYESNFDISKIPVQNISEIIVNRGTSSALYGTTGTVGSINIVTKKPTDLYAKTQAEYGLNGDYTLNMAQGNVIGDFYYWVTGTIARQAPFEVSKKLDKSERREWFDKFFPSDPGYTYDTSSSSNAARDTYLNDTGKWPHQEMLKYVISAKTGYTFFKGFETGISANYTKSESKRYTLSLTGATEEYQPNNSGVYVWSTSPANTLKLNAAAFNWRDAYSVTAAPYVSYENGDFYFKGNVFYIYNYEFLDGYADSEETTAIRGWGGAHSNWNNTSAGFNIFPSYKIISWNKLNSSVLFRWDKHLERLKADPQFVGGTSTYADASYNQFGYHWFNEKEISGKQVTVALEDEISFEKAINVPVNLTAGISYDAQTIDKFQKRNRTPEKGTVATWGQMTDQYIAKSDSTIWGKRDSFNPVVGATYEPLKDFLLLRGSFSQKSKLPTMSQYANVTPDTDTGLKPEKSYNTNAGLEFFFFRRTASLRGDYFYSKFNDKLATVYFDSNPGTKYYTNIKGEVHQGVEVILGNRFRDLFHTDIQINLSYIYTRIKNLDNSSDSSINKGDIPVNSGGTVSFPQHQVIADIRFDFFTKTSLDIFGEYTANAVAYAMKSNPDTNDSFSTKYYKKVKLHDPIMLNVKISQKIFDNYEAYALCRNILDDYDTDPFNPGPGRQFFFGLSAEI